MKKYTLNIADIYFSICTNESFVELEPEIGYESYLISNHNVKPDINIEIKLGKPNIENYNLIFDAPTSDGVHLWSIYSYKTNYFLYTNYQNTEKLEVLAFFDNDFVNWTIYINSNTNIKIDPLTYPLGPIIMLYATLVNNGIMIHSSGVNYNNKSYIFSGFSGIGKTTISELFKKAGATRINDDRLIIREINNEFIVYNTPMFYFDDKKEMKLNRIFILAQSLENKYQQLHGALAFSKFSAFCMQHNFHKTLINNQLDFVHKLIKSLPVGILSFKPDNEIVDFVDNL